MPVITPRLTGHRTRRVQVYGTESRTAVRQRVVQCECVRWVDRRIASEFQCEQDHCAGLLLKGENELRRPAVTLKLQLVTVLVAQKHSDT